MSDVEKTNSPAVDLELLTQVDGPAATVTVRGELDVYTAPQLRGRLHDLLDDGVTSITLDLADLGFIDSSGLGVIVGTLKRLRERDGNLVLRSPSRATSKVLDITGLAQILDVIE